MTAICDAQTFSLAEQKQLDSLNAIVANPASHDTSLARAYVGLSEILYVSNLDTMIPLCEKTRKIAEEAIATNPPAVVLRSLRISLSGALNNIGFMHKNQGDIQLGLEYYHKSLKIDEELGNKRGMATSYNNIGFIQMNQGSIPLALDYFHKSLKIREEISDKQGTAYSYNNIGFIHNKQGAIPLALEYFHKSLKIREEISDKKGMSQSYNNIGAIHDKQGAIPLALEYFHKSLKIREEISDKRGMAYSYNNIGGIHKDQGDIPLSLEYFQKGLQTSEEIGDKQLVAGILANLGKMHLKQASAPSFAKASEGKKATANKSGALASARKAGERGLKIAQDLGFPDQIERNADLLSKVAKQEATLTTRPVLRQAKFKEALEMYELQVQYGDSMNNEATQKASIRQQTKYEFEKAQIIKEQQQKEQARIQEEEISRRDNLQYSVILIVILMVFGGVLGLGFVKVSPAVAEGLIFFAFLILFEFLLVLSDPYVDNITGGAPAYKLLTNAVLAGMIFPLHSLFERLLKKRLIGHKRKTIHAKVAVEKQ